MDNTPLMVSQTAPSSIVEIRSIRPPVSYNGINVTGCRYSGTIQSIIGMLAILFGAACMGIDCSKSFIAWPVWGGVWFMTTGFVGCRSVTKFQSGSHTAMIAYATLCIFSGVIAFNMLIAMSQAAMEESKNSEAMTSETARVALDCVLVFLDSVEICAAVWGATVAFRALHKINKQRSMITSQQTASTYQTMGSTEVISSSFQPNSYGTPGYPPPPGYDAPPKYEDLPSSETPPAYHDGTPTTDQSQLQQQSS